MIDDIHLANFSEEQLVGAIKPLLVHDNWPYFEEYLRREQQKQVNITMSAAETPLVNRGQGAYGILKRLLTLKHTLLGAS